MWKALSREESVQGYLNLNGDRRFMDFPVGLWACWRRPGRDFGGKGRLYMRAEKSA